jgi:hypothetical protein
MKRIPNRGALDGLGVPDPHTNLQPEINIVIVVHEIVKRLGEKWGISLLLRVEAYIYPKLCNRACVPSATKSEADGSGVKDIVARVIKLERGVEL